MSLPGLTGEGVVAGVVGSPVRHSLSPLIHNAWIAGAGLDAVYVPLPVEPHRFPQAVDGLRAAGVRGVNVTLPFKAAALDCADRASRAAEAAGAANLLLFQPDGTVEARNTDGEGLLAAFAEQAPRWRPAAGPVLILGAGGAARGAAAALVAAGAQVLVANRTLARAEALAALLPGVRPVAWKALASVLGETAAIVNATSAGLAGAAGPDVPLESARPGAWVMDMVYRPLRTPFLNRAAELGLPVVDGLAMLIGQAAPSFEALFGCRPPPIDVRALALAALGEAEA